MLLAAWDGFNGLHLSIHSSIEGIFFSWRRFKPHVTPWTRASLDAPHDQKDSYPIFLWLCKTSFYGFLFQIQWLLLLHLCFCLFDVIVWGNYVWAPKCFWPTSKCDFRSISLRYISNSPPFEISFRISFSVRVFIQYVCLFSVFLAISVFCSSSPYVFFLCLSVLVSVPIGSNQVVPSKGMEGVEACSAQCTPQPE